MVRAEALPLAEGYLYKVTASSKLVVPRKVVLCRDRFQTFHDYEKDPRNKKTWYLDRKCELIPKNATDSMPSQRKIVRPQSTWAITATVKQRGEEVKLFLITVVWPTRWAAKGYTTFTFGFETLAEAQAWHGHFSEAINFLRDRSKLRSTSGSRSMSQTPADSDEAAAKSRHRQTGSAASARCTTDDTMSVLTAGDDPSKYGDDADIPDIEDDTPAEDSKSGFGDSDDEEYNTEVARKAVRRQRMALSDRWIPYKQTNGVSIYHHNQNDDATGIGGEYMASSVVRGSPSDVLDVLMHGSVNTTILGPARTVEVLQCVKDDKTTKEVLRIEVEAPGWAGTLCAPREVLLERVLKMDDLGLYSVLFNSLDCPISALPPLTPGQAHDTATANSSRGHGPSTARRLFKRPVIGKVRGGYTIAPLQEYKLNSSPESLITCIMKIDLGGVCGEHSWLRPMSDLLGWREAFLDRILMSVLLVRDEVEQGRFAVQPFQLVSPYTEVEAEEKAAEADGERTSHTAPPMLQPMSSSRFFTQSSGMRQSYARLNSERVPNGPGMPTVGEEDRSSLGNNTRYNDALEEEHPSRELESESGRPNAGMAVLDMALTKQLSTLEDKYWSAVHAPGEPTPFSVRGPTYLKDQKKMPAGLSQFVMAAMDVVEVPEPIQHVARFLPSIRESRIPFAIIINLIIPGNPLLNIVATFATEQHPDTILTDTPKHPMEDDHGWQPFDFVLHKFVHGSDETRNKMLKLIPHIANGSWLIKQSVGTTPVILGKALKTTYHVTPQYIEVDIDVSANNVASYVTAMVRGATKSLTIDMGFVLEGTAPWELPEALLGGLRLKKLDLAAAKKIDTKNEIPLKPPQLLNLDPKMEGYLQHQADMRGEHEDGGDEAQPSTPTQYSESAKGGAVPSAVNMQAFGSNNGRPAPPGRCAAFRH
uniref:Protein ENHANCED DISEASE RESISTANCE 2 C-terminal domain-containing protein n=1 Tax=Dunaliella tertiolecta TaxID=3047 RepID=A0A6S8KGU1_DUNTE|mmetsp:Transcript_2962/g.7741  ORF Transcript_2962/g.7741 Transcript_2962/m.7741 type:complete len:930 (+) Transcript_2962:124-2913(+)